jgi:hypothetical protein
MWCHIHRFGCVITHVFMLVLLDVRALGNRCAALGLRPRDEGLSGSRITSRIANQAPGITVHCLLCGSNRCLGALSITKVSTAPRSSRIHFNLDFHSPRTAPVGS